MGKATQDLRKEHEAIEDVEKAITALGYEVKKSQVKVK